MPMFSANVCAARSISLGVLGFLGFTLAGHGIFAQESAPQVETKEGVFRITHEAEAEGVARATDTAYSGEIVEYGLSYRNASDAALESITIAGSVPEIADYISAEPLYGPKAVFEVLVDDIGWVMPPVTRYVDDGKGILRPVAISEKEYEALRWRLAEPIAPGEEVSATYRVKFIK